MISVTCLCGTELTVDDEMLGKQGRCPSCAQVLTIEPEIQLELEASPAPAPRPRRRMPACPGCRTEYPDATVEICTACGINLVTGGFIGEAAAQAGGRRPSLDRMPLRSAATRAAEEKGFFCLLGEAFTSPGECFEAFGTYVYREPSSVAAVIGLFFVGMMLRSIGDNLNSVTATVVTYVIGTVFVIVIVAVKAALIELSAILLGGVSRFMNLIIALVFLEGVTGVAYGTLAILPLPFYVKWLVMPWSVVLYLILIAKTYDYPAAFALFIAVVVWAIGNFLSIWVMAAALIALS